MTTTGRPDPRVERSRRTVLEAAFDLLYEGGASRFSVDEVARRCGVAKTTIYRHWPTREALVLDACAQLGDGQTVPDTGSCRQDVTAILRHIATELDTANWSSVLPSIVDLAERDEQFAKVHSQIQRGHAEPLRTVLCRAVASEALSDRFDVDAAVAMLLGSLFYRRWFRRAPIDDDFIESVVESVLLDA